MTQNHLSFQGTRQRSRARPDTKARGWGGGVVGKAVRAPQSEGVPPTGAAFTGLQKTGGALRKTKPKNYCIGTSVAHTLTSAETRKCEMARQSQV